MIAVRPFLNSDAARLADDRWAKIRRATAVLDYEAIADQEFPDSMFPNDVNGQASEAHLYAAFLALARGVTTKADMLFGAALQTLPILPVTHEFWVDLTLFVASSSGRCGPGLEQALRRCGLSTATEMMAMPLPALTNFIAYATRSLRAGLALDIVEKAGPQWCPEALDLEAWAFRIALLQLLAAVKDQQRFTAYLDAYSTLLDTGATDPAVGALVKLQLGLLMAKSSENAGDAQAAIRNYQAAISALERQPGSGAGAKVLLDLLNKLTNHHLALGNLAAAQRCYERSLALASEAAEGHSIAAALGGLAAVIYRQQRYVDAVMLRRYRCKLMDEDPSFQKQQRYQAHYDLCIALMAANQAEEAQQLLGELRQNLRQEREPRVSMLVAAEMALFELTTSTQPEDVLLALLHDIITNPALSYYNCDVLLRLVGKAWDSGRHRLAAEIVTAVCSAAATMPQPRAEQTAALYLSAAALAVGKLGEPERADKLYNQSVDLIEASVIGDEARRKLDKQLVDVMLARIDASLAEQSDEAVSSELCSVIGSPGFVVVHAAVLLQLAEKAFAQERSGLARTILMSVFDRTAEFGRDEAERTARVYLRMCYLATRHLADPSMAEAAAERGLKALLNAGVSDPATEKTRADLERYAPNTVRGIDGTVMRSMSLANASAKEKGHAAPETVSYFESVQKLFCEHAARLNPEIGWRTAAGLTSHWVAMKDLGRGTETIAKASLLPPADIDERMVAAVADRISRLLSLRSPSALGSDDLAAVVDAVSVLQARMPEHSSRLAEACGDFLLRSTRGTEAGFTTDHRDDGDDALRLVKIAHLINVDNAAKAVEAASRLSQSSAEEHDFANAVLLRLFSAVREPDASRSEQFRHLIRDFWAAVRQP